MDERKHGELEESRARGREGVGGEVAVEKGGGGGEEEEWKQKIYIYI